MSRASDLLEDLQYSEGKKSIKQLEEYGQNDIVQAYLNMIGPKGKYSNKKLYAFTSKSLGSAEYNVLTKYDKNPKALIDALEDINYHGEAGILSKLVSGDKGSAELAIEIQKEHEKQGHLPYWLSVLRNINNEDTDWMLKDIEKASTGFADDFDLQRYDLNDQKQYPPKFWKMAQKLPKEYLNRLMKAKEAVKPDVYAFGIKMTTNNRKNYSKISQKLDDFTRSLSSDDLDLKLIFKDKNMPKEWFPKKK